MSILPQAAFRLPEDAEARTPPESRGLARDGVRMAVAEPGGTTHLHAHDLPDQLAPGDLVVVNTSATLPAAVDLVGRSRPHALHVSTQLGDGAWVVELRRPGREGHVRPARGAVLRLPGGVRLRVDSPHPAGQERLWRAVALPATRIVDYLPRFGRPIRYPYVRGDWPLEALQNVYASHPGSAEMPSAGRPLTERVLVRLLASGVVVTPLVLHTGVASQESHEPPQPEWFAVPATTARLVAGAREAGGRVVAVGTTVVRALESAHDGAAVRAARGWTDLVLGPERRARAVDGLLTGLHAPEASHLRLLEAVAGGDLVARAYADLTAPAAPHYLWHEFGDTMLLLP